MSSATKLTQSLPWTTSPLLVNAPMGGFAGGKLAVAVSRAGGLGLIGSIKPEDLKREFDVAVAELRGSSLERQRQGEGQETLPIGVGLLPFALPEPPSASSSSSSREEARQHPVMSVLMAHRPAVVWLFAAHGVESYAAWTDALRAHLPRSTQVWIQVGTAGEAVKVARRLRPDALVVQGSDAGGHGMVRGAGVVAVLPETIDALAADGSAEGIAVLASGGIVDARGVAAAFALGADGVVMGTRFLAANETLIPHAGYRAAVLAARDGATATVRSDVFDNLAGPSIWPEGFDGRSLVTESWRDAAERGVGIDTIRERYRDAVARPDKGFGSHAGEAEEKDLRQNVWVGAGVGLVNKVQSAEEIINEVHGGIRACLEKALALT